MAVLKTEDVPGSDAEVTEEKSKAPSEPESKDTAVDAGEKEFSLDELKTKYAELKSTVGKQARDLGTKLKKAEERAKAAETWKTALEKNPEAFIRATAAEMGLEFKQSQPTKLSDVLGANADKSITAEQAQELIKNEVAAARKEDRAAMKSGLDSFVEERLSTKYPSYDEDTDLRRMVRDRIATGDIPIQEVQQAMVLVERMPTLLQEAGEVAVEEYIKGLVKKNKGLLEGGGEGEEESKKEQSPEEYVARLTRK